MSPLGEFLIIAKRLRKKHPAGCLPLILSSSHPLIRFGVYAKDGLPLGTISMNPLGGVFCRRGTAKSVEQGASYSEGLHALSEWLLGRPSSIRHTLPLSAGFWPSTQHTPYSPAIRMAFRPSVRRLRKKHPVGCLPLILSSSHPLFLKTIHYQNLILSPFGLKQ